jgi:hypothetical protein
VYDHLYISFVVPGSLSWISHTENKDGNFGMIFPDRIYDMVKFGIGSSDWHMPYQDT